MSKEKPKCDEKPLKLVPAKAPKVGKNNDADLTCIVHYHQNKSDLIVRPLSEISFQKIKDSAVIRQSQNSDSAKLPHICSQVPKVFSSNLHGYHRWCYKNFTNTSKLTKRQCSTTDGAPSTSKKLRTAHHSSTNVLLPADECIFCGKNRITKQRKVEKLVKCVTRTAEESIKRAAEEQQDEDVLLKIQGIDLVAREAHYHNSCRKSYTRREDSRRKDSAVIDAKAIEENNAHATAFQYIALYVQESIIEGSNVERMTMLKEKYQHFMLENNPKFFNESYKTDKLKSKLIKKFGSQIQFWQPNYRSELVYSSHIPKGQAVESAFEVAASDSKRLEEAALVLHRHIKQAELETQPMTWPPSANFLLSDKISPP